MTCKAEDKKIRVVRIQLQYVRFFCQANPEVQVHWWWLLVSRTFSMAQTNKFYARLESCPIGNTMHVYQQMCSCIHLNKLAVLYFKKKDTFHRNFFWAYSGGQNIVDTLYMFYLYALTLGANNFWSVKIVVLYLVCNWRLKCFLSIPANILIFDLMRIISSNLGT